ncbi:MAG: hypothetical protein FWG29_02945 [Treponema sp.]|nr:hypothetical protein [Treponema sp.]
MKKLFILLTAVSILASCMSYPKNPETLAKKIIYWDENIPKEECAAVFIQRGLTATNYNGISVDWGKSNILVYLPPGQVIFLFDADYDYGYTHFSGKNVPFLWTFNAGDIRYLQGWARDGEPVILVVDPHDTTRWDKQNAFIIPKGGRTVLE